MDNNDNQRVSLYGGQVFLISNQFHLLNFQNSNFNFDFSSLPDGEYGVVGVVKEMKDPITQENVTTDVLVKICKVLECDIGDIVELVKDENEEYEVVKL